VTLSGKHSVSQNAIFRNSTDIVKKEYNRTRPDHQDDCNPNMKGKLYSGRRRGGNQVYIPEHKRFVGLQLTCKGQKKLKRWFLLDV